MKKHKLFLVLIAMRDPDITFIAITLYRYSRNSLNRLKALKKLADSGDNIKHTANASYVVLNHKRLHLSFLDAI